MFRPPVSITARAMCRRNTVASRSARWRCGVACPAGTSGKGSTALPAPNDPSVDAACSIFARRVSLLDIAAIARRGRGRTRRRRGVAGEMLLGSRLMTVDLRAADRAPRSVGPSSGRTSGPLIDQLDPQTFVRWSMMSCLTFAVPASSHGLRRLSRRSERRLRGGDLGAQGLLAVRASLAL